MQFGLEQQVNSRLESIFPVGSIYTSMSNVNPAVLFKFGTWEQIKDRFLLAAGDSYSAGSTGGEVNHTLTVNEMPRHGAHLPVSGWSGYGTHWLSYDKLTAGAYGWNVESGNEARPYRFELGESQSHNNMPPYLTVYVWRRTA